MSNVVITLVEWLKCRILRGDVTNNCPVFFHLQYKKFHCFGAGFHTRVEGRVCVCVGYEAEMAALSLACCSPGSEVTAAWKSAEWCWAKFFISSASVFWASVEERDDTFRGRQGKTLRTDC